MVLKESFLILGAFAANNVTNTWQNGPTYNIEYIMWNNKMRFDVTVPNNTWLGISFKQSMNNADQIVFQGTGQSGNVIDYWATQNGMPTRDTSQDWEPGYGYLNNGTYSFSVTRELVTNDTMDMSFICPGIYQMAWTGNSKTSDMVKHNQQGDFQLVLGPNCTTQINQGLAGGISMMVTLLGLLVYY